MTRRVGVFTGTRAEYGLLRPVLRCLEASSQCELLLFVSGTHLSHAHGNTLDEIRADGFEPRALVDIALGAGAPPDVCHSMGLALAGMGDTLTRHRVDILVVLGDRYETFAAAAAAAVCGIPIAHIHGGDSTVGAIDEAFRHSITKMSHLHFTSCEPYRQRVIQLGEAPARVWNVGALGVENALTLSLLDEAALRADLGLAQGRPYLLCTFHPVTLEPGAELAQVRALCEALDAFPEYDVIFTGANADAGGSDVNRALAACAAKNAGRVRLFASLGVVRYLSAAKYAACVLGNSSSGVVEIPSLGTPVVDIGNRQLGRIRSAAVLHCDSACAAIITALRQALTPAHRGQANSAPNPYQGENTSCRIARTVCEYPLEGILMKQFYDVQV